jgi:hypothetical protein
VTELAERALRAPSCTRSGRAQEERPTYLCPITCPINVSDNLPYLGLFFRKFPPHAPNCPGAVRLRGAPATLLEGLSHRHGGSRWGLETSLEIYPCEAITVGFLKIEFFKFERSELGGGVEGYSDTLAEKALHALSADSRTRPKSVTPNSADGSSECTQSVGVHVHRKDSYELK